MKRLFYILCMLGVFVSCQKSVLVSTTVDLGRKVVDEEEGSFPVLVTTEGAWYAVSDSKWIEVDGSLHSGKSTFTVKYRNNFSYEGECRLNRIGRVKVLTCDGATRAELRLWQKGKSPVFLFPDESKVKAEGGLCRVECVTDLPSDGISGLSLSSDASWLSNITWGSDCRSVVFDAQAGSGRSAVITLSHTDSWGIVTKVDFKISQE